MATNCTGCSSAIDPQSICDHISDMILSRPVDPTAPAHERVYRALRTQIMHGVLAPGAALTLRGIGKEFDVSMTPAREAVRRLVAEGALFLSSSGRVSTPELSNDRIEELASLRAMIEPELASRALPRAHFALIERLEAINQGVSQMVARHDSSGYIRMNLEFHRTLYLRAQAPAMLAVMETVWLQLGPTMRALYGRLNRTEPPHHHKLILAALKAGDDPGLRLSVRTDATQGLRMLKA
jgi:DNA-binding GntR family transcriptional regulator